MDVSDYHMVPIEMRHIRNLPFDFDLFYQVGQRLLKCLICKAKVLLSTPDWLGTCNWPEGYDTTRVCFQFNSLLTFAEGANYININIYLYLLLSLLLLLLLLLSLLLLWLLMVFLFLFLFLWLLLLWWWWLSSSLLLLLLLLQHLQKSITCGYDMICFNII